MKQSHWKLPCAYLCLVGIVFGLLFPFFSILVAVDGLSDNISVGHLSLVRIIRVLPSYPVPAILALLPVLLGVVSLVFTFINGKSVPKFVLFAATAAAVYLLPAILEWWLLAQPHPDAIVLDLRRGLPPLHDSSFKPAAVVTSAGGGYSMFFWCFIAAAALQLLWLLGPGRKKAPALSAQPARIPMAPPMAAPSYAPAQAGAPQAAPYSPAPSAPSPAPSVPKPAVSAPVISAPAPASKPVFCTACGVSNIGGALFCSACGKPIRR